MNFRRTGPLLLPLLLPLCVGACGAYPTQKAPSPIHCADESRYDFDPGTLPASNMYTAVDSTPGAAQSVVEEMIPGGALCGATSSLVLKAAGNKDWGSLVGFHTFANSGMYRDESAYEGLSFWARAPGSTNNSFTLLLDDANTYTPDGDPGVVVPGINCVKPVPIAGGNGATGTDPGTGTSISTGPNVAAAPNACGNGYSTVISLTMDWRFYAVPFARFQQTAMPNRVPNQALTETGPVKENGLLTSKLKNMVFRMPKEMATELWIAKLAFYRSKGSATAGDGGISAP